MKDDFKEEIKFWDSWFEEKGGIYKEEYKRRLNPNLEFDEHLKKYLVGIDLDNCKILDAGAGPVSSLGKVYNNKRLNITAIDPLAEIYQNLYKKHSYTPSLSTQYGDFLKLDQFFQSNYFDFVYSRNSLDHCEDPLLAIVQLIQVCKPGGFIFFENAEAEATREKGMGLHQWDFLVEDGDLFIQNYFSKKKVSLKEMTGSLIEFINVNLINEWITVEIKKKSAH